MVVSEKEKFQNGNKRLLVNSNMKAKNLFFKKKTRTLIAEQEEVSLLRTSEHEQLQQ